MARESNQTATESPSEGSEANPGSNLLTKGDAVWTVADEAALIEHLIEHMAEGNENKAFKKTVFTGAVSKMELIRTEGGPKTSTSCQGKYTQVRVLISIHLPVSASF